jgi:hypothetical protein
MPKQTISTGLRPWLKSIAAPRLGYALPRGIPAHLFTASVASGSRVKFSDSYELILFFHAEVLYGSLL